LELVVLVGEGELRAFAVHRIGDAPRDRTLARDADDQRALAVQETHVSSAAVFRSPKSSRMRRAHGWRSVPTGSPAALRASFHAGVADGQLVARPQDAG